MFNKQQQGNNLIEAIFAITIFGLLITGSVGLTLRYINNISRTQELLTVKIFYKHQMLLSKALLKITGPQSLTAHMA